MVYISITSFIPFNISLSWGGYSFSGIPFLQRALYKRVVSRIPIVRRREKLPCLRGRTVYSMINFWSHLSPSIKHLAEYYSRKCRARLFPTRRPASFRGSRFIVPPRVYRRVNHCIRSNASATFISQSRALSRPVNILLSQVNVPNSRDGAAVVKPRFSDRSIAVLRQSFDPAWSNHDRTIYRMIFCFSEKM